MNTIEFCTIPAIAAVCYGIVEVIKRVFPDNGRLKNAYPLLASLIGAALGAVLYLAEPQVIFTDSLLSSVLAGAASGLSATGGNELITRLQKVCTTSSSAGSGSKPRFYTISIISPPKIRKPLFAASHIYETADGKSNA